MAIDPSTGLDESDPEIAAWRAQQQRDQAAMTHAPGDGAAALPIPGDALPMAPVAPEMGAPPASANPILADLARQDAPGANIPANPAPVAAEPPPPATPPVTKPAAPAKPGGGAPAGDGETAAEKKAQSAVDKATADQAAAIRAKAQVEADRAAREQAVAEAQQKEIARVEADHQRKLEKAGALLEERQKAASGMKVRDMFEGHDGALVGAALFSGLGAFASAFTGGPNYALKVIDDAQEAYKNRQLTAIEQAHKGAAYAQDALANARIEIAAQQEGMYKRMAQERDAATKAFGARSATASGDAMVAELNGRAAEKRKEWTSALVERTDKLKTSAMSRALMGSQITENNAQAAAAGNKAPSADQAKAAGFGERMSTQLAAVKSLPPLTRKDRDVIMQDYAREAAMSPQQKAALMAIGRYKTVEEKLSDNGRAYYGAMKEFINANLRRESGAAISSGEMQDAFTRYGAVQGDKEADRQRKLGAMEDAARSAVREAGPAARTISPRAPAAAPSVDVAGAKAWLASPEARRDPARAAAAMKKLRDLGAL